jgi:hypothetical protein
VALDKARDRRVIGLALRRHHPIGSNCQELWMRW